MNKKLLQKSVLVAMAFSVAACGSGIKETKEVLPDMSSNLKDKVGDVVEKTEPQIEEKVDAEVKEVVVIPLKDTTIKAETIIQPANKNTFIVRSTKKDSSHPKYQQGTDIGFTVNGVPGKDFVVERGQTYTFDIDTGMTHDFYLTTNPKGWGTGAIAEKEGVTGQFTYKGQVSLTPNEKTPDVLYYQCVNHKYMGGKIYVADKGEKIDVDALSERKSSVVSKPTKKSVSSNQVEQKINFANMMLSDSSKSVKRIAASGHGEAKGLMKNARDYLAESRSLLKSGKNSEALDKVDLSLRTMNDATRMVPSTESVIDQEARYAELLDEVDKYEKTYKTHVKGAKSGDKMNEGQFSGLVSKAKTLANSGDYTAANKDLQKAQQLIAGSLNKILHAKTVTYDKNFETPQEEYEYELARHQSYEELIPLGIDQKQPAAGTLKLMDNFVKKSTSIKGEAVALGKKGDYKNGVLALQAATDNLIRALRMIGVGT
ncbi:MAG: hypothetical protein L3J70_08470 [Gammaproteobacteria bacterium]|nr:hypothetical protein [Gammaproteobacteria bacterium]